MKEIITKSVKETMSFARELSDKIPSHTVILMSGDLGAGKTTFTRGFVSKWGLEKLVSSPTFTVMNKYSNEKTVIFHFDLYRLESAEEVDELGIDDFMNEGDYTLVEWPDIAEDWFDFPVVKINISLGDKEGERIFKIEGIK